MQSAYSGFSVSEFDMPRKTLKPPIAWRCAISAFASVTGSAVAWPHMTVSPGLTIAAKSRDRGSSSLLMAWRRGASAKRALYRRARPTLPLSR